MILKQREMDVGGMFNGGEGGGGGGGGAGKQQRNFIM